jgi:hypothetical protein
MWALAQLLPAPRLWFMRYMAVVPRQLLAAARGNLVVVSRLLPAKPLVAYRRYLVVAPGRCPRRR